jgi:ADP-ribose pyrophosphatase
LTIVYREVRRSTHGEELRWAVATEAVANPDGGPPLTRGLFRHPGICVIVPCPSPDEMLLIRQYRFAVGAEIWELPAGTLPGREEGDRIVAVESPEECAGRELEEETGYAARRIRKVGECYAMPGISDEIIHVFVAEDLVHGPQRLDPGETITGVRAFSRRELGEMVRRGDIRDAKTLVGLFHAGLSVV